MNGFRLFVGLVIAMVAATAIGGLYLGGSPGKVRSVRFDEQRVGDLQQISSAVENFYDAQGGLPADAHDVANGKTPYYVSSFTDPETRQPYEYRTTGGAGYELCATFSLPTQPEPSGAPVTAPMPPGAYGAVDWTHPAGRHCYELDASAHVPREACGVTNPCTAADTTCATLPGKRGTYCVPRGQECLAAGCPGSCVIAGSYPVTVNCPGADGVAPPAQTAPSAPPAESGPAVNCSLMQEKKTGKVACVACTDHVCTGPSAGWQPYLAPKGGVSVPYACYVENGNCVLAQ